MKFTRKLAFGTIVMCSLALVSIYVPCFKAEVSNDKVLQLAKDQTGFKLESNDQCSIQLSIKGQTASYTYTTNAITGPTPSPAFLKELRTTANVFVDVSCTKDGEFFFGNHDRVSFDRVQQKFPITHSMSVLVDSSILLVMIDQRYGKSINPNPHDIAFVIASHALFFILELPGVFYLRHKDPWRLYALCGELFITAVTIGTIIKKCRKEAVEMEFINKGYLVVRPADLLTSASEHIIQQPMFEPRLYPSIIGLMILETEKVQEDKDFTMEESSAIVNEMQRQMQILKFEYDRLVQLDAVN